MSRKLLVMLLVLCMLASSLAGCGAKKSEKEESKTNQNVQEEQKEDKTNQNVQEENKETTDNKGTEEDSTTEEVDPTKDQTSIKYDPYADEVYPEGKEVVFWCRELGSVFNNYIKDLIHEYNSEGRGYTVRIELMAESEMTERFNAAFSTGSMADVFTVSYNQLPDYYANGYVALLDGLINDAVIGDILDNAKSMVTMNGETYALPMNLEASSILYYRKDLFEAAGYKEAPKTWDELIEIAKATQTDGCFGLVYPSWGSDFNWSTWGYQYAVNGNQRPITDDWSKAQINEGYKDLFALVKRLYDEKIVPESALCGYTDIKAIGEGQCVMQMCGSWGISELQSRFPEMVENIGVSRVPTFDGEDMTTATVGGWTLAIDSQSKCPEGAADFLSWMYDVEHPERTGEIHVAWQYSKTPAFKSVCNWAESKVEGDHVPVFGNVSSYGVPEATYNWDISVAVGTAAESYVRGEVTDLDEVLDNLRNSIQTIIDTYGLAGTNPIG